MKSKTWPSVLAYTSARILMFCCAVILLYLAGARGILLLFLGLVVSALASYVLLNRQRTVIADKINGRIGRAGSKIAELRGRLDEGTATEDTEPEGGPEGSKPAAAGTEDSSAADTADEAVRAAK